MSRLAAICLAHHSGQDSFWFLANDLADLRVDRPSGASRFQSRAAAVETHMPDFRLPRRSAVVNPSIHHQPATNAAPKGHVEHRIEANACAMRGFAQGGHVRIIIHEHSNTSQ